jgi:hypothetical protein
MKTLIQDRKIVSGVRLEIESHYTLEEIKDYSSFQDFWEDIDASNAYEGEWERWKRNGIKAVYSAIFKEMRE